MFASPPIYAHHGVAIATAQLQDHQYGIPRLETSGIQDHHDRNNFEMC